MGDNIVTIVRRPAQIGMGLSSSTRSGPTVYLGVLVLLQGAGKLYDVTGYARALGAFEVFPDAALPAAAILWMVAELISGGLLIQAGASRAAPRAPALAGAVGAAFITLGYAGLTTSAWLRGLAIPNCTCFGVLLPQALGPAVLAQDAAMIGWTAWVLARLVARTPGGLSSSSGKGGT